MMTAPLVVLGLWLCLVLVVGRYQRRSGVSRSDSEDELRVGLELHAIRRQLDVAYFKHQSRAEARRLRRELDEDLAALDENHPR